jgi:hypothetical protein
MRRSLSKLTALATALLFGVFMAACEGSQGPAGEDGADGVDGTNGVDGTDGVDANENCIQCHFEDADVFTRQVQYLNSTHYLGGNFERGGSASCSACHAHEGFVDRMATGDQAASQGFDNPSPVNCRTCHDIHVTYTDADWALTETDPVDLWWPEDAAGASMYQVDFGGANLCANCHQARVANPTPVIDGADVVITSQYWGTHYGTQGQTLGGVGYYEFTGSATIAGGPSSHGNTATNADGCITCHMATAYGSQAGGHTWNMTYEYHGGPTDNIAGCEACHTTITDFDVNGVQTAVDGLLDDLLVELRRMCIILDDPADPEDTHPVPGTYPANLAAAALNFKSIEKDHSHGVHNPPYVVGVLTNSVETVTAMTTPPAGCPPIVP